MTKNKKRVKIFQIVQHNSYINSRQVIAKKKCKFHWKSSASFNRFGPFQSRSELQQENRTSSWDRVWGAGIFYCNSWNTLDNCPIKIPSLEGIIYLFHIPRPASHVESLADDTWNQLLSGTYNLGSWREGEREWTILRSFPVFELILYLQGRHEYSLKHSSSLFNKRYLCQHTRHSCFNCSIRVEMNRQQLLGVAREVQSFSSPSLNNR